MTDLTWGQIRRLLDDGWERDGDRWYVPVKYWPAGTVVMGAMTTRQALECMEQAKAQEATQ